MLFTLAASLFLAAAPSEASPARPVPPPGDHAAWVRLLGDDDWGIREQASSTLASEGERALPALVAALLDPDPEISSRASEIVEAVVLPSLNPYGWLGIVMQPSAGGVHVVNVLPGSPAETAGLRADDLITSVDGDALTTMSEREIERTDPQQLLQLPASPDERVDGAQRMKTRIQGSRPGTLMRFRVRRGRDPLFNTDIRLGALPKEYLEEAQQEQVEEAWEAWIREARRTGKPPPLPGQSRS